MNCIRTLLTALALTGAASANNIAVSNITLTDLNTVADTVNVQFDVTWQNGWRVADAPANWDAAWLFVKFHTGSLVWSHASLDTNAANHTAPVDGTIAPGITGTRAVGVFLHRSAVGTGTTTFTGVKLKWNYGLDGVADNDRVTVDVTGIEMVYVPQGAFYVGDGTNITYRLCDATGAPFLVANAGPVTLGGAGGMSYISNGILNTSSADALPTTFPNGYNAFYCMKYEVSQGQRVAAANMGGPSIYVNGTERQSFTGTVGSQVATTPDRAYFAFTSTPYGELAYLDWAGLRPMTDMEYEKACRGPLAAVANEYAWGNAAVADSGTYTLSGDGTSAEAVATGYRNDAGNSWAGNGAAGPARVGMFAIASYSGPASPRVQSGATYYGIYDMTGNVEEMVVKARFSISPTFVFSGVHGDGAINLSNGQHNVPEWGSAGALGTNFSTYGWLKGGSYQFGNATVAFARTTISSARNSFRGVRTAP